MSTQFDVVVAGGGPAGAAAAIVLARSRRRVLLAYEDRGDDFRVGEAVPPAVRPLLHDLGVLNRVHDDGHLPCYGNVSVWGGPEPMATDFIFDPHGHGWHLDRARFDATLRRAATDAGAEIVPAKLVGCIHDGAGWWVTLAGGKRDCNKLRAALLVDATGRRATVARWAGAVRRRDDSLVAFCSRFRTQARTDLDCRTAVESEPDGWWYTARVPSGERVVAFLTDADLVNKAAVLSSAGFVSRLGGTSYVGPLLVAHSYEPVGPPHAVGAETARRDRFSGNGWMAIGDAATSFDPVSSQGILTALFTGLKAGLAIDRTLAGDTDAMSEYIDRVEEIDRVYRLKRDACYAAEGRWLDRPFWRRRVSKGESNREMHAIGRFRPRGYS